MARFALKPLFFEQFRSVAIAICGFVFLTACSQVNPEISATEELPALKIDSASERFTSKNFVPFDASITGSVSKFASRLQLSADDGKTWTELNSSLVQGFNLNQAACADFCPFSFSMIDVGTKFPSLAALAVGAEGRILLRGMGQFGNTTPGIIYFKKIKGGFISIGSISGLVGSKANRKVGSYMVVGAKLQANAGKNLSGTVPTINVKGAQQ